MRLSLGHGAQQHRHTTGRYMAAAGSIILLRSNSTTSRPHCGAAGEQWRYALDAGEEPAAVRAEQGMKAGNQGQMAEVKYKAGSGTGCRTVQCSAVQHGAVLGSNYDGIALNWGIRHHLSVVQSEGFGLSSIGWLPSGWLQLKQR